MLNVPELLAVVFNLLIGQTAEILFRESAEEKCTSDDSVSLNDSVQRKVHGNAVLVANQSNRLFIWVDGFNVAAHNPLQIFERVFNVSDSRMLSGFAN